MACMASKFMASRLMACMASRFMACMACMAWMAWMACMACMALTRHSGPNVKSTYLNKHAVDIFDVALE